MIGNWKNIEHLEEEINLPELMAFIEQKRKDEYEHRKFLAAMQGVDLDKAAKSQDERLEAVKRRAEARLAGGEAELERKELTDLGFAVEAG